MKNFFILIAFFSVNLFAQPAVKDAEWYAPACKPKLFGIQDNKGGVTAKAQFDFLSETDGTAWIAYSAGKYGVINSTGQWIIKPNFEIIVQFVNGKAVAGKKTLPQIKQNPSYGIYESSRDSVFYFGVVDASGVWVIDPVYNFLRLCDDGSVQYSDAIGNFGFLNPDGTIMLRAQYEYASRMTDGVAVIGEPIKSDVNVYNSRRTYRITAGKYDIIDRTGKKINSNPYELIREFSEGRAAFNKDGLWKQKRYSESARLVGGKWGFLDRNGKEIVEAKYDYVYDYKNGKAKVRSGVRVFWIDVDGKECAAPGPNPPKEFTIYCELGFYGYLDLKGNWAIEPQYFSAKEFSEGLAAVMTLRASDMDCDNGLNDASDDFQNSRSVYSKPLSYLLSLGTNYSEEFEDIPQAKKDSIRVADSTNAIYVRRLYGYIDATGNMILPAKYEVALPFHNGRAYVSFRGKWGVIDKKGNWIFAPVLEWPDELAQLNPEYEYEFARRFHDPNSQVLTMRQEAVAHRYDTKVQTSALPLYSFYEGIGVILKYNKYGFIDTTGKIIAPPIYDEVLPFANGFAAVRHGNFWGYIDKTGKEIIPMRYKAATSFSNDGLACVGTTPHGNDFNYETDPDLAYEGDYNIYYGYIDTKGNWVIKPQFTNAGNFSEGLAAASSDFGKSGYINKTGKFVIPPKYDYASEFQFGFAYVKINMFGGVYLDKNGKVSKIFSGENIPFDKSIPLRKKLGVNSRYGFVNEKGEEIIPAQFSNVGNFSKVR